MSEKLDTKEEQAHIVWSADIKYKQLNSNILKNVRL
jgi:hypothetical protein